MFFFLIVCAKMFAFMRRRVVCGPLKSLRAHGFYYLQGQFKEIFSLCLGSDVWKILHSPVKPTIHGHDVVSKCVAGSGALKTKIRSGKLAPGGGKMRDPGNEVAFVRPRRAAWVYPRPQGWFKEMYENQVMSSL